jgi:ubiquinone/menaquinone biosynthesis C-methylase UbiE
MKDSEHLYMPKNHMDDLYKSMNPLIRFVFQRRLSIIGNISKELDSEKILDAGCGEGHCLEHINGVLGEREYYGVDITKEAIDSASTRCKYAKLFQANIKKLPFDDNYFDLVICTEVIEHIYDTKAVLSEIERVLKPGGNLIITFPNEINWTIGRIFLLR